MIQAAIFIELINGNKIKYVRDVLAAKTGTDGATPANTLFAGYPCEYYMYTGAGTDTYTAQTGAGKILGDFTSLQTAYADTNKFLTFPESTPSIELVRYNEDIGKGKRTYVRNQILKTSIVRIYVEETWCVSPVETESMNTLPSWDPRFSTNGAEDDNGGTFIMPAPTAIITPNIVPGTPTTTKTTGTINWFKDPNYAIYMVTFKGVDYSTTNSSYTFSGLTASTSYSATVFGTTAAGRSGPSKTLTFTTTAS